MSSAQEKANLARIRDNQRRSRARRKGYLQELEARLRQCELQGIEASAEIQLAARKVANENKRLRSLLAQHGVGDDTVEAYIHTDERVAGQYRGDSSSVQDLEHLLNTRKSICTDPGLCGKSPIPSIAREASRSSSQPLWDMQSQRMLGKEASASHKFMMSSDTTSRSGSSSIDHGSNNSHHASTHDQTRLQSGMSPVALARNPSDSVGTHATQFDHDAQISFSNPSSYSSAHQQHMQPHDGSTSYVRTTDSNVNSCVFATDMITTMAGADPNTVRSELGCLPGIDCEVDNHLVFSVMDRYTESHIQ